MKIVLERLEHEGVEIDENLRAEIAALWHWGIERISNPALKASLIEYYRSAVPWQFFVSPSSASGKHHPPHHNKKGESYGILPNAVSLPRGFFKCTALWIKPKIKRKLIKTLSILCLPRP